MAKLSSLIVAAFFAVMTFAAVPALACDGPTVIGSTECAPPPSIDYKGKGGLDPTLKPEVCLTQEAWDLMNGPGVDFWFTYYLRYPNGSAEDMEPVMRTACITQQWVSKGTKIGFWVDCHDPADGKLYRWWWETAPVTDNGRYAMVLVQKQRL